MNLKLRTYGYKIFSIFEQKVDTQKILMVSVKYFIVYLQSIICRGVQKDYITFYSKQKPCSINLSSVMTAVQNCSQDTGVISDSIISEVCKPLSSTL